MSNNFYVGQKVVCVDIDEHNEMYEIVPSLAGLDGLELGQIYTIRKIGVVQSLLVKNPNQIEIYLKEILRPNNHPNGLEAGYFAFRFKPLEERKTDISVFTKMLVPNKKVLEEV